MARAYLRPFGELATGFARRYRRDIFYRTGWNVVLLQVVFAIALLLLTLIALSAMYDDVVSVLLGRITESISQSIASGTTPELSGSEIAFDLEYEKQKAIVLTGTGVLIIAATFGYLITRIALVPTGKALQSQKQFVGNVAHELRTPLSIIKTNTEVALFNERLDKDTQETLRSNIEELDRISDIINNLLSMNALLRPEKMEFGNVDLNSILERARSSLEDMASHKKISISIDSTEEMVWGNASGVEQIIMNILKNAVRYTSEGGRVSVKAEPDYLGHIDIIIEDTGVGINEKDLEHIFEPFYRGEQSRNRASGGSGLGLAIVSELVKLHRGTINIRSSPGQGTAVRVSLPVGKKKPEDKTKEPKGGEIVMDFSKKT